MPKNNSIVKYKDIIDKKYVSFRSTIAKVSTYYLKTGYTRFDFLLMNKAYPNLITVITKTSTVYRKGIRPYKIEEFVKTRGIKNNIHYLLSAIRRIYA